MSNGDGSKTIDDGARGVGVVVPMPGGRGAVGLDPAELEHRRAELERLIGVMSPAVEADGGELVLGEVNYETGVVNVTLRGSCSTCSVASVTLDAGVERILRQRLAWVTEVHSGVEEAQDPDESRRLGKGGWRPVAPV